MIEDEKQDQAALHALELLQGEEAAAFREELAKNPELRAFTDELAEAAAAITHALPAAKAPPEVLPRLLAQIRAERQQPAAPRATTSDSHWNWLPLALAASIALAAAVGYFSGAKVTAVKSEERIAQLEGQLDEANTDRQRLTGMIASMKDERIALEKRVADLRQRDALTQVQIATLRSQVKAYAKVVAFAVWDAAAQRGLMRFDNLPVPSGAQVYQMWIIDPRYDLPVSAGIFSVERTNDMEVNFTPTRPIARADKFAISIEPPGGSARPSDQIVLISN